MILGEDHYLAAVTEEARLMVLESPVAWIRGGCDGCVFLDDAEARWASERLAEDDEALRDWWQVAS